MNCFQDELFNDVKMENEKIFRPIHYLGSKLRILNFIEESVNRIDPTKGRVCDLFAGSGVVGFKLSQKRPVMSVDIQEYSRVISNAILFSGPIPSTFLDEFLKKCTDGSYSNKVQKANIGLIEFEKKSINKSLLEKKSEDLCTIIEHGSIAAFERNQEISKKLIKLFQITLDNYQNYGLSKKQNLVTMYFGGVYFSYQQTVQIDIILELIHESPSKYYDKLLAALLSSVSDIVNTVGKQFAQPLRPRKSNGNVKSTLGKSVLKDRSIDLLKTFKNWIIKYNQIPKSQFSNLVLKTSFENALDLMPSDTTLVYADPPYTRDHYSRFYHVLETISLRDTPEISTVKIQNSVKLSRGLYRVNRHQSPFCIRSQAPSAFNSLFSKVSAINAKLILSYSPYNETEKTHPRVITINELQSLAEKYFEKVEILSPGVFNHSKLNNSEKHLYASNSAEILLSCH